MDHDSLLKILKTVIELLHLSIDHTVIDWEEKDLESAFQWAHTLHLYDVDHHDELIIILEELRPSLPYHFSDFLTVEIISNPHGLLLRRFISLPKRPPSFFKKIVQSFIRACVFRATGHHRIEAENVLCSEVGTLIAQSALQRLIHQQLLEESKENLILKYFTSVETLQSVSLAMMYLRAVEQKHITLDTLFPQPLCARQIETLCFMLILTIWEDVISRAAGTAARPPGQRHLSPERASILKSVGIILSEQDTSILIKIPLPLAIEAAKASFPFALAYVKALQTQGNSLGKQKVFVEHNRELGPLFTFV